MNSIIGNTTGGVIETGAGTWTLNGASTYTGATAVNAGTLVLDLGTGSLNAASSLALGGGGFTVRGAGAGSSSQTLGNLSLAAGTNGPITVDPNNGTGTTLTLGSTITRGTSATLLVDYSSANGGTRIVSTTATGSGTNKILGYALVKEATATGLASIGGGNMVSGHGGDVARQHQ